MDFELQRSGGPGSGPSLSLEQQQQLEMQRELERQQLQVQQFPQVLQTLDKQLADNPQTQALLKRFDPEEQDEIKKALAQGVTERIGPNGLRRIDLLTTTNDGGLYIRFNRSHSVTLHGDQLPQREQDGQSDAGLKPTERTEHKPANEVGNQTRSQPEREPASHEPMQQQMERPEPSVRLQQPEQDRALPLNQERDIAATHQRLAQDQPTQPALGQYTSLSNLAQRQQQALQNTPLDDSQVAKPHFENGLLVVEPIPYTNPFSPQSISHEPAQRHNDIQSLLDPKLGNALHGYSPEEQNQLKQALSEEISDLTGNRLKIDLIERREDGRLLASLNDGLQQVYLDPQQVLPPTTPQQTFPPQDLLSQEVQTRWESQLQIQQQVEQLTQHQPFERLAIENRLREAVGDERIESLRIEGEDTIQLGLRNGMVLTASTYELLNMDSGRELLQRSQVDPAAANQSTDNNPTIDNNLEQSISREPLAYTVQTGDGPERIGHRLSAEHPDAAAWYVLQDLMERYGEKGKGSVHYSPNLNRITVHPGQHGEIDLSQRSEQELADAARQFRIHVGKESAEDRRREAVHQEELRRQQAQREQQSSDESYWQFVTKYIADQPQLDQSTPQNRISYEQKPINYYATNLHAMGLDPASEDAYISRRNQEGGWTGVTAATLTAKRTFYEAWNIVTLGAVKSQDELVLQHNHNLITDEQYNRGTLWNAGSKTAMVLAGGWMARTGGTQAMELKTLTQSVKTPWPYVGAGVSGGADALGQYYRTGDVRMGEVAFATAGGFLLTPYAMRANIAGNGIIGGANGLANASFQNAYYGDKNDLVWALQLNTGTGIAGGLTGAQVQNMFPKNNPSVAALLQTPIHKTQGFIYGNISSQIVGSGGSIVPESKQ